MPSTLNTKRLTEETTRKRFPPFATFLPLELAAGKSSFSIIIYIQYRNTLEQCVCLLACLSLLTSYSYLFLCLVLYITVPSLPCQKATSSVTLD